MFPGFCCQVKSSQFYFNSTKQNKTKPQACLSQVSRIHSLQQEPPQTQFWTLSNIWQNVLLSFLMILYKFKKGSNDVPAACLIDQHVRFMARLLRAFPPLLCLGPGCFVSSSVASGDSFFLFCFVLVVGRRGDAQPNSSAAPRRAEPLSLEARR